MASKGTTDKDQVGTALFKKSILASALLDLLGLLDASNHDGFKCGFYRHPNQLMIKGKRVYYIQGIMA